MNLFPESPDHLFNSRAMGVIGRELQEPPQVKGRTYAILKLLQVDPSKGEMGLGKVRVEGQGLLKCLHGAGVILPFHENRPEQTVK